MGKWRLIVPAAMALATFLVWTPTASGYGSYGQGCNSCHPQFEGGFGNPLHDMHLEMTSTCTRCHDTAGDNPATAKCAGCHIPEGLRAHHRNVPVSTCGATSCHNSDDPPGPETTNPPYYGLADINIDHPCFVDPTGLVAGEDFDGDGQGLDNDGDLAYDFDDLDCEALPVVPSTWGQIKALF